MGTRWLPVVAAVIRRGEQVLLARRPMDKARPGQWEFPGGKVDDGENPEGALVREIREELGCTIHVADPLMTVEHRYPDVAIRLSAYWAEVFIGEPYAHDVLGIAWVGAEELAAFDLSEADRTIADAVRASIAKATPSSDPGALLHKIGG